MGFMKQKKKEMASWPNKQWWILEKLFSEDFADMFRWKQETSGLK